MSPVPGEDRNKPTQESGLEIEDTEYPDVIINAESSDSDNGADDDDDEDNGYMGYQALSQDGCQGDSDEEDDENDNNLDTDNNQGFQPSDPAQWPPTSHIPAGSYPDFPNSTNLPSYMQVPAAPRPDRTEIVWNQPRVTDIRLDTGQADKIRSLMTDIRLPSNNIPDWARSMSDDQWQNQVVNKLVNTRTSPKQEAGAPYDSGIKKTDKSSSEES